MHALHATWGTPPTKSAKPAAARHAVNILVVTFFAALGLCASGNRRRE